MTILKTGRCFLKLVSPDSEEQAMRTIGGRRTAPTVLAGSSDGSRNRQEPELPTVCLGDLLVARRADTGVSVAELSRASGLADDRIAAVESGRHDLSDEELSALLDRYHIPSPGRRWSRTVVEIDLEGASLRLVRTHRGHAAPAADRNLLRYLTLVHRHFDLRPGVEIPLKAVDLGLLRSSLGLRRHEVESRVDRMTGAIGADLLRNRNLLTVAMATGLVVAAGAIVLIPLVRADSGDPSPAPATGIDPRIDIGTPLVVERDPADLVITPAPSRTERVPSTERVVPAEPESSIGTDAGTGDGLSTPRPQIGTALVVERPSPIVPTPNPTSESDPARGPPATGR